MSEKPKILLVYPYWLEDRTHTEDVVCVPIGLYWIAALLKENGFDVELRNWSDRKDDPESIRAELAAIAPDIVGLSIMQANRFGGLEIAEIARQVNPQVVNVFGGVGATTLWEFLLSTYAQVDCCIVGEGEYTMLELAQTVESGRRDFAAIAGLALRGVDGTPTRTSERERIRDLNTLPIPAKHFTYQHVSLTRGCPGHCTFCGSPSMWGPKVRFRSPEHFVDELEMLHERGVDFLYVSDDTFTFDRTRVLAVCAEIMRRGLRIEWAAISRVDRVDAEVLAAMRRAGCIQISYGVESGSQTIRDALNKNIRAEDVRRAFALTTSYGILARAYFIYGCPGETDATIDDTLALIRDIRPLIVHFFILSIFPGTALYERYKARTGATDAIWADEIEDIKHFETDDALDLDTVERFGTRLRETYYAWLPEFVDSIELVDDPEFAPMHADFLARLGMTFNHGDYASNLSVLDSPEIAERLYRRALSYHPDATASLDLGMIHQKRREYPESIRVLARGLMANPGHERLSMALAVSLMNCGDFEKALGLLAPMDDNPQALHYAAICHQHLGQHLEAETKRFRLAKIMEKAEQPAS
ncbi:radical SAM superfamily enzyme YgiQ (UPF0313 family) [Desulfobaculum xiamenense]|uniref:Radical SAM superfamily enzyme YgiQ (UPF0313 family) n=1 Tax=Desulfobaculum xiamenense TaxID=995050 RepID=A0A846QVA2_9BACT|nr:radical SAM protein [Desulfobaculum xiamenense]NJB69044.1 radical SAM superfamily enzyme YgiQ (UPF0313 family) [Desulfobaculum xiamenense]